MRHLFWRKIVALPLIFLFLLATGCATTGGAGDDSAAGQRLESETGNMTRTIIGGAVAGAVLGAIAGYLISGGRAKGALIGAAAGGALGAGAGYRVARAKKNYARAEDRLDHYAKVIREENQRLASYNDTVRQVVAEDRARLAGLRRLLADRKISRDQAAGDVRRARRHLGLVDKALASAKKKLQEVRLALRDVRHTANQGQLRSEVKRYERAVYRLQQQRNELARAIARAPQVG